MALPRICLSTLCLLLTAPGLQAQETPSPSAPPSAVHAEPAASAPSEPQQPVPLPPPANYDKAIFLKPIPPDQLTFLKTFMGGSSYDLFHDKQFRKVMKALVPDCTFHYGRDMSLMEALDTVFEHSRYPVQLREGRYLMLAGASGPYLSGRAFLWLDLTDGIGLGGFYFHPTNGEPTPSLNVFSRQVREDGLTMSQLPPAFAQDVAQWSSESSVAPVLTRYFITGSNRKILLEHDENYCLAFDGSTAPPGSGCEQMNADAADYDLTAAEFVEATHHATNATAWMLSPDDTAFLTIRERTCGVGLSCRIRVTREHIHVITGRRH